MEKKNPAFPLLLLIISKSSFRTKPCKVNFLLIVFLPSLPITILQHREMTSKPPKKCISRPLFSFPQLGTSPSLCSQVFPRKKPFFLELLWITLPNWSDFLINLQDIPLISCGCSTAAHSLLKMCPKNWVFISWSSCGSGVQNLPPQPLELLISIQFLAPTKEFPSWRI